MSRVIVLTSGKGGVGKTTITANLGVALAKIGASVVMLDADMGLNNLDVVMNVESKIVYDIVDILQGKCRIGQALIQNEKYENLFILPSNGNMDKNLINKESFSKIVDFLKSKFDFVLIDCPAGIDRGFFMASSCANEAIIVVTPHLSAVRDADKVLAILSSQKLNKTSLVINRIRGDMVARKEMLSATQIENQLGIKIVGVVPESDEISLYSTLIGGPKEISNCEAKRALGLLGHNVFNESNVQFDYLSKYQGIFGLIRRNIRRRA